MTKTYFLLKMDSEFKMQEELYSTDFCFPRYDLYDKEKNYDYSQKFYAFDCNIGTFCCYANRENILKIIEIAEKYGLENIFLTKMFNKTSLLEFKQKTVDEIRLTQNIPNDFPVVYWFYRGYNVPIKDGVLLKDYLNL